MRGVLLTRPREESERLAARLRPMGYVCYLAPMLEVAWIESPSPCLDGVRAVMATSAHAFGRLSVLEPLKALPCYCVGSVTAQAARLAGFQQVCDARGDGAALGDLMARSGEVPSGSAILHLAGRDAHPAPRMALAARGISVKTWVVYEAHAAQEMPESALSAFRDPSLSAALFFSARTALTFVSLAARYGLESECARVAAIGISHAAVEPLETWRWRSLAWSDTPTEDGIVARLREALACA